MRKPRAVVIGSSVESLPIADDNSTENLEFDAEVTIWRNGTFSKTFRVMLLMI